MHPTARSAPGCRSGTGTEPAEWHRSHSVSAPASWAAAVMPAMSATAPDRYATWDRHTSADVVVERGATAASVTPASMSVCDDPQLQPARRGQPLQHVPVGGEVVVVGDDHPPVRPGVQRRGRQLVQVDAGRVGRAITSPGPGAEDAGAITSPACAGQLDPVGPSRGSARRPTPGRPPSCSRSRVATGSRPSELPSR